MMNVEVGMKVYLIVNWEMLIGYMLVEGEEEILLYKNEIIREFVEGEEVEVFLYFD